MPYPIIPGHVTTGTLEKIHGPLSDVRGEPFAEGDRVAFFDVHRTCGRCLACTVHHTPTRCPHRRVYGISEPVSEGLLGGWAQKVYLEPGVVIARLPARVSVESYIGGGCGLITAMHIIDRARLSLGSTVVVQGAGAVGLSTAALARQSGAGRVIVIGGPANRLELALAMGADDVIPLDGTTAEERRVRALDLTADVGADVVVEAAGSPHAFEEGLKLARDGGAYVVAGHYTNTGDSRINAHEDINRKHLDIRGCWGSEAAHFFRALEFLDRHPAIPFARIGARTYGLADLNDALETAAALRVPKALVDPWR